MTEETGLKTEKQTRKKPRLILAIIVMAFIGIGGVFAYTKFTTSEKAQYLKAEVDTFQYLKEEFEKRFVNELAWAKTSREKPVQSAMNLSASYHDPYSFGGYNEIEEIINSSSFTLHTESDLKNNEIFLDIGANVAGLTFEDFKVYLSDKKLALELPFLEDVLEVHDKDLGRILHELDPYSFEDESSFSLSQLFESYDDIFKAEDRKYLADTYGKYFYNALPDYAFSKESQSVQIAGKDLKADRLSMYLSEDNLKAIFIGFYDQLLQDQGFKDILVDIMRSSLVSEDEITEFIDEFYDMLGSAKEAIQYIDLPGGFKSDIWVSKGLIVQRSMEIIQADDVEFSIYGEHQYGKDQQILDYEFLVNDGFYEEEISLLVDLFYDGQDILDKITLSHEDYELSYLGVEEFEGNFRHFERSFSFLDKYWEDNFNFYWDGQSSYEKDKAHSSNQFYVDADDLDAEIFTLDVEVVSQIIREVQKLENKQVKNLGKMSEMELEDYLLDEAADQFYQWMMENFSGPGF